MPSDLQISNLRAKDGTAGISIADSTGNVSLSGSLSAGTLGSAVVPNESILKSNPVFIGHETGKSSAHTSGTVVKIQPTEVLDSHNWWDNDKYTPQQAGIYCFMSKVRMVRLNDSIQIIQLFLRKNGSDYSTVQYQLDEGVVNNSQLPGPCELVSMNGSSDYLELFCGITQSSSSDEFKVSDNSGANATTINIFLVRAT